MKVEDIIAMREELLELPVSDLERLVWHAQWRVMARDKQIMPAGDWNIWLILAGRGWGKTRTGAQSLAEMAISQPETRWSVIAPTHSDLRGVCFEGESGLVRSIPQRLIADYNKSLSELKLINGSLIQGFSASEPNRLRGPQFHGSWMDELAAWEYLEDTWDMAQFGLRLGKHPRVIITTTPRPLRLIRELVLRKDVVVTRGSTYENKANLAKTFFDQIAQYEGTKLGRQELHAEVLDDEEGGIFKRSSFKLWPHDKPLPRFEYIVQSYDTAHTAKTTNHPTACTVWGIFYPHVNGPKDMRYAALLCDAWSEHLEYPDLRKRAIKEFNTEYGGGDEIKAVRGRKPDVVLIENKASGISLIQDLQRAGVPARGYNPGNEDKLARAHTVSHLPIHGLIYLPESTQNHGKPRNWCNEMLDQLCTFSRDQLEIVEKSKSDKQHHFDYVDSCAQAWQVLRDMELLRVEKPIDPDQIALEQEIEKLNRGGNPYAA